MSNTNAERDELAELLQDEITDSLPSDATKDEIRDQVGAAVAAVLAAGYRKQSISCDVQAAIDAGAEALRSANSDESALKSHAYLYDARLVIEAALPYFLPGGKP